MGKKKYAGELNDIDVNLEIVYAIWVNNHSYLGSGTYSRCSGNCSKLRRNVHHNKTLQNAYNEHGEYKIEILEYNITNPAKAREIEDYYINYFKLIDSVTVCNVRSANNGCTSLAYNKYARLTIDKVKEIKGLLSDYSNTKLAEMFNCSSKAISDIRRNVRWVNV